MKAAEIRAKFLGFFKNHDHEILKSSSLAPKDDPTLLFTNAGMVQFKRVFTGEEKRDYKRAATSQKCVRAGGKHNDLENVGYTARHHTFFEMLGNFSFGDYFKEKAIEMAWDLLVRQFGLPEDKLYATVYREDDEAFGLWQKVVGLPEYRIYRLGEEDNFWAMGDTGPCGPCSEILIDQGEAMGCGRPDCQPGCDCDRYLELWNLVFMQFERSASGLMSPLPKPSIDTGLGLERIAAVIQGVHSNFESDLFKPLIGNIEELSGIRYLYQSEQEKWGIPAPKSNVSIRVIADHARAMTFLIADGILPENVGRGYVLRRILRRAVRFGRLLGLNDPFLHKVSARVIAQMGGAFPELKDGENYIRNVIKNEEERFSETLDNGLRLLSETVEDLKAKGEDVIPGSLAFKLYDTFGFPLDLVQDVAREHELKVDEDGFNSAMEEQRKKSRASWKGSGETETPEAVTELTMSRFEPEFLGYDRLKTDAKLVHMMKNGQKIEQAETGEEVDLVFDKTPFYAESGGQVGDVGRIISPDSEALVLDTVRFASVIITHRVRVEAGTFQVGRTYSLEVNPKARWDVMRNHTATHILHRILRQELGDHVKQAGSSVGPDRLRFDFTHFSALEPKLLARIEARVNEKIRENLPVKTEVMSMDQALETGAVALFEERYGETVRVVGLDDFSRELCGGTHVSRTGDIGGFFIESESSAAAGVRRLEAVTGRGAVELVQAERRALKAVAEQLKTSPAEAPDRLAKHLAKAKDLERNTEKQRQKASVDQVDAFLNRTQEIKGVKLLAVKVQVDNPKIMRDLGDKIRDKIGSGIIVLGAESKGKALLLVMVTQDLQDRFHAGNLVKELAQVVGGSGGGRPDMAQAGGPNPANLKQALAKAREIVSA